MTGCAGISWLLYYNITGSPIVFTNKTIQLQIPLLIVVIMIKYSILMYNRFKTREALWRANLYGYVIFLVVVLIIDFWDKMFPAKKGPGV